jgi:hypothetical protein
MYVFVCFFEGVLVHSYIYESALRLSNFTFSYNLFKMRVWFILWSENGLFFLECQLNLNLDLKLFLKYSLLFWPINETLVVVWDHVSRAPVELLSTCRGDGNLMLQNILIWCVSTLCNQQTVVAVLYISSASWVILLDLITHYFTLL